MPAPPRSCRLSAMPMLPSRHYVSEFTQFIRELIEKKPDLPEQQFEGRELLWDKSPDDIARRRKMDEGLVPQPAYVYQPEWTSPALLETEPAHTPPKTK